MYYMYYIIKKKQNQHINENITISVKNKIKKSNNNRWHYLAVKSLSVFFREITSSNNGDFYCLNCFDSYHTLNKLKNMEEYVIIIILSQRHA